MIHPRNTTSAASRAFTLVELLVVITVISILLAFSAPALFSGLGASRLGGAGERMLSGLSEAQQTAFSQNCAVEVQFYVYGGELDSKEAFRGYRIFKVSNTVTTGEEVVAGTAAITNLPEGVYISAEESLSPALSGGRVPDTLKNSGVSDASYAAIRFLPDGTCRKVTGSASGVATLSFLPLSQCYFTLLEDDGKEYSASELPKNFFTIQTDPFTGKSRSYRPGF